MKKVSKPIFTSRWTSERKTDTLTNMNTRLLFILLLAACGCSSLTQESITTETTNRQSPADHDSRMAWWRAAKFGMFIHYGLYSGLAGEFKGQPGGAEWIQRNLGLDTGTYAAEALPLFNPAPGCTDAWAQLAAEAGCKYMVLTTKHHDGFALWQTDESIYNAYSLFKRDMVSEFVNAATNHNLKVGFYHSVIDWHHESYDNTICPSLCYPEQQAQMLADRGIPRDQEKYKRYLHAQVRELLSRYGKVDIMWWDYSQGAAEGDRAWGAPRLMNLCHELQPGIVMNNRLYAFAGLNPASDKQGLNLACGDFTTPEKRVLAEGTTEFDWEACVTVGDKWGYNRHDKNFKSAATLITTLQQCAARGGNLLLNIGPRADGSIPDEVAERFRRIGAWMKKYGESIYETRPVTPDIAIPNGLLASQKGDTVYIFLPRRDPQDKTPYVLNLPTGAFEVPTEVWENAPEGLPVLSWTCGQTPRAL